MENILFDNSDPSIGNSSLLREFPYWQPTLAIAVLFNTAMLSGVIIIIYLPLMIKFLRIMKKDQLRALSLIHVSLLIASILDDVLRMCVYSVLLPSALRYCVCSNLIIAILIAEYLFFFIDQPFAFSCLSVLQFFVILGKKKIVNLKVAFGMIVFCIGVSFVSVASIINRLASVDNRSICDFSFCPESKPETNLVDIMVFLVSLFFVVLLPSFALVVVGLVLTLRSTTPAEMIS